MHLNISSHGLGICLALLLAIVTPAAKAGPPLTPDTERQSLIVATLNELSELPADVASRLEGQLRSDASLDEATLRKLLALTPEHLLQRLWGIAPETKKQLLSKRELEQLPRGSLDHRAQRPRVSLDKARSTDGPAPRRARTQSTSRRGIREALADVPESRGVIVNDDCSTATVVTLVADGSTQSFSGDTCGASNTSTVFCGTGDSLSGDVWFRFVGTGTTVTARLCDSGDRCTGGTFDTKLQVFEGSCGSLVCIAGNDDGCPGLKSQAAFATTPGSDYFVVVFGFAELDEGDYVLDLTAAPAGAPAVERDGGEDCVDAVSLDDLGLPLTVAGDTIGADDSDPNENTGCGTPDGAPGRWYTITGTGTVLRLSTCNAADFDTKLRVHACACDELTCIDGNDNVPGCGGLTSDLIICSVFGEEYKVLVFGFGTSIGDYELTIEDTGVFCFPEPVVDCPPPPNDDCVDAEALVFSGGVAVAVGDTTHATDNPPNRESALPPDCGSGLNLAPGVWYSFIGTGNVVNINACDATFDTDLSLYCAGGGFGGGGCDDLNCVARTDGHQGGLDCAGYEAELEACTEAGVQYYILVDGFSPSDVGLFSIIVSDSGLGCDGGPCEPVTDFVQGACCRSGSCAQESFRTSMGSVCQGVGEDFHEGRLCTRMAAPSSAIFEGESLRDNIRIE
ncbi:MAG: hypothetical protein AAF533_15970, partial [Acidobacteriota bacterium]